MKNVVVLRRSSGLRVSACNDLSLSEVTSALERERFFTSVGNNENVAHNRSLAIKSAKTLDLGEHRVQIDLQREFFHP